uniref:Outer capsid glycoprotein VP7 n=1 Tax=Rotavirus A (strain RVA/Turkey/Ireland/Ty-1/1978/G7P[17]) TaxID=12584 RepID=VP7_ROTA1|nr:RecName: Full=Outer capsid glycoprotein VP7; Flags: Precursor [Avian rotavirus Ty-1]AAB26094.1 Vp7 [Avian rotavirus Ty-1]
MYSTECTILLIEIIFYFLAAIILYDMLHKMANSPLLCIAVLTVTLAVTSKCYAQNYGINVPITGSMDVAVPNKTDDQIGLSSTLCIYYPKEAATQMNDAEWKSTVTQLLLAKGWPTTSVYLNEYADLQSFSNDPQLNCDYNIILAKYDQNETLDMSELAELLLYEWLCNPMDVTLYYYQQTSESNKWIAMGSDCTIKVCPLNTQTLGIGCKTTDVSTFEELTTTEKLAIIDVVDGVNHKANYTISTCTIKNCIRLDPRENVAIIQVGGPEIIDISEDPMVVPHVQRATRINWKKWWQIFYTVVDYINTIIQAMSKRSRSLNTSAYYFRV